MNMNMNMNINIKHAAMIKSAPIKCILQSIMLACLMPISQAQEESAAPLLTPQAILIPPDLTAGKNEKFQVEEWRIGGRLERLTVRHKNGITEIYQNQRDDAIWFAHENELGEVQNVRQWRLGGW